MGCGSGRGHWGSFWVIMGCGSGQGHDPQPILGYYGLWITLGSLGVMCYSGLWVIMGCGSHWGHWGSSRTVAVRAGGAEAQAEAAVSGEGHLQGAAEQTAVAHIVARRHRALCRPHTHIWGPKATWGGPQSPYGDPKANRGPTNPIGDLQNPTWDPKATWGGPQSQMGTPKPIGGLQTP